MTRSSKAPSARPSSRSAWPTGMTSRPGHEADGQEADGKEAHGRSAAGCGTSRPQAVMSLAHAGSRQGRRALPGRQAAGRAGLFPERLAPARLGHEEPPRPRVQSGVRAHGDARRRPRLFPGPDLGARAHRPLDRAAVAAMRRAVLHARHLALGDPGRLRQADGAARQRRALDPARRIVRRADRHGHGRRGAAQRRRRRHPGVHRRRARDPLGAQHDPAGGRRACAAACR